MKTRLFVASLFILALSSCIKDFINEHPHNEEEIVFTETNYAYEPLLYEQHLINEMADVQAELDSIQEIINEGKEDEETLEAKALLEERSFYLDAEQIQVLSDFENLALDKPIPCPDENAFDLCFPNLDKLVFSSFGALSSFVVLDEEQKVIFDLSETELSPVPGLEGLAEFQEIDLADYSGGLFFFVEREDSNGAPIQYSVSALK